MFSRKATSLSLTQSQNYSFAASFENILSNNKKIYLLKFSNIGGGSKLPQKVCMVSKKNVDLVRKKYDMLLITGLI